MKMQGSSGPTSQQN